jgi:hypothetical protein
LQSAARALCPPLADKEHTCSLKSIFRGVHAAAENVILFYFAVTGETLRGFVNSLGPAPQGAGPFLPQKKFPYFTRLQNGERCDRMLKKEYYERNW